MYNQIYHFHDGFKKMEHDGLVIVACIRTGFDFKMTKECYEILEEFINRHMTVNELLAAFESDEDREYFRNIIDTLIKYKIIVANDEPKKYIFTLELTNRCNLQCKHCCMSAKKAGECTDPLTTDDWKRIVDKMVGLDIDYIVITGGEPMVRKDFFEISRYVKDTLKVPLQLMSNATLINESNADEVFELFDDFAFSIDGADEESCASIRGAGVFGKVMNSIDVLKKRGMEDFSLSYTITKLNQDKVEKFHKLCDEIGAFPMERNFDYIGRATENDYLLPDGVDQQFEPAIAEPSEDGHYYPEKMPMCVNCAAGCYKFAISYDAKLYPCPALMLPEFDMGSVDDLDSLTDYIVNEKFKDTDGFRFFEEMHPATSKKCADCPVSIYCDNCILYSYLMKHRENFDQLCDNKKKVLMAVWN